MNLPEYRFRDDPSHGNRGKIPLSELHFVAASTPEAATFQNTLRPGRRSILAAGGRDLVG